MNKRGYHYIKRCIDILFSAIFIILFFFPGVFIAVIIKCSSKGSVFFSQTRIGINGKHFTMYKFRTMRSDTPKNMPTHLLENPEVYITSIGAFLRKSSLDELPQLVNIFLGDMSFVGPRPALWNQDDLIEQREILGVNQIKPGLTGWAQINGRDELDIITKSHMDREYVDHESFSFDLKCLLMTVMAVIRRDGIKEGADKK